MRVESGEAVSTVKRLATRYRPATVRPVHWWSGPRLRSWWSWARGGVAGSPGCCWARSATRCRITPDARSRLCGPSPPATPLTVAGRACAPAYTSALPTSACRGERCPRSTPERTVSDPDRFSFFLPRCFPVPRSPRNLRGTRVGCAPALRLGIRCCRPRRLGPEWPPRYRRSAPACRSARRLGWPLGTVGSPASGAPLTG